MSAKLKIKRGTTAGWANPDKDTTLEPGQLGVEYLTSGLSRLKVGTDDASHTAKDWSELDYVTANPAMYKDTLIHFSNGMELKPLAAAGDYRDKVISAGNIQIGQYEIFPTITTATLGYMKHPFSKLYLGKDPESATSGIEAEIVYSGQTIGGTNKQISLMSVKANGTASLPYLTIGDRSSNSCTFYTDILGYNGVRVATGVSSGTSYLHLSQLSIYSDSSTATLGNSSNPWSGVYTNNVCGNGSNIYIKDSYSNPTSNVRFGKISTTGSDIVRGEGEIRLYSYDGTKELFNFALCQSMPSVTYQSSTNIYSVAGGYNLYPKFTTQSSVTLSAIPSAYLGTASNYWYGAYISQLYGTPANIPIMRYNSTYVYFGNNASNSNGDVDTYLQANGSVNLQVGSSARIVFNNTYFRPNTNSTSSTTGLNLGQSTYQWRTVYAYTGTIQTSDRSAKSSIHYLEDSTNSDISTFSSRAKVASASLSDISDSNDTVTSGITMDDVVEFVKELQPVTFCYLDGKGEATEENSDPEMIQLGLIADDMVNSKLFKYVGVETEGEEVIEPEEIDEETGEITKEAVTETKTVRGLQAIPLATAALTTCKYLLEKVELLEQEIASLKN